jgi:hypothetical protein
LRRVEDRSVLLTVSSFFKALTFSGIADFCKTERKSLGKPLDLY